MSDIKLSVITPVWNRGDLTLQFLKDHWTHYHNRPDIEWIVINNGSTDHTAAILSLWYDMMVDRLTLIANGENLGFSRANNQGADVARGEQLLFVNNDVIIKGDYLSNIIHALDSYPEALVGAELLDHDTGWNRFGDNQPIPYIPGWCLAMTKKTFFALGGFDERYGIADYEDVDLCYTASSQGRLLLALDNLPIRHISNQTAKQLPDRRAITDENRIKFADKWELPHGTK